MVMILVRDKIRDNIYCPTESAHQSGSHPSQAQQALISKLPSQ
jgi:hypothetical protein